MPEKENNHRAWKPKRISFWTPKGVKVFENIVDVFNSKLCSDCIAFIDKNGYMYVSNLKFVILYERVSKQQNNENSKKE